MPFDSVDATQFNQYYQYELTGIPNFSGNMYYKVGDNLLLYDITIASSLVPNLPVAQVKRKQLRVPTPAVGVYSIKASTDTPNLTDSTFSIGGCSL